MSIIRMANLDLQNQRVLIREDLNVPVKNGSVSSAVRINAALPTIKHAIDRGACVMLLSHRGRPTEGQFEEEYSLLPIAEYLIQHYGLNVRLEKNWLDGCDLQAGEIVLCENVRFQTGEKKNDDALAKKMAALCDVFVMDAFGTAHRAQALSLIHI